MDLLFILTCVLSCKSRYCKLNFLRNIDILRDCGLTVKFIVQRRSEFRPHSVLSVDGRRIDIYDVWLHVKCCNMHVNCCPIVVANL